MAPSAAAGEGSGLGPDGGGLGQYYMYEGPHRARQPAAGGRAPRGFKHRFFARKTRAAWRLGLVPRAAVAPAGRSRGDRMTWSWDAAEDS